MPNIPIEAINFIKILEQEEKTNDLIKIDSLPSNAVIQLKNNLDELDFKINGQTIFSYENDYIRSVSNVAELAASAIQNLVGYPTLSLDNPSEINGPDSINLNDTSFGRVENKSTLFTNSIANLNLVAALGYDENKDPFNPIENSIYNLTPNLNSNQTGLMDSRGELGTAFR